MGWQSQGRRHVGETRKLVESSGNLTVLAKLIYLYPLVAFSLWGYPTNMSHSGPWWYPELRARQTSLTAEVGLR